MRVIRCSLIFLLLLGQSEVRAQLFDRPEQKFQEGLSFFKQGLYESALRSFSDITSRNANDEFAPLAHYYYALSAYRLKKYSDSNLMLKQLLTRYPTWAKLDDAYYLIATNYFELAEYERAFDYLRRIGDPKLGKDVQGLKQHYLSGVRDISLLKSLNTQYPNDRVIAVTLVDVIQSTSGDRADLELSDRLTNQYNIDLAEEKTKKKEQEKEEQYIKPYDRKWTKGYYNVAVLFPYRLKEYRPSNRPSSNQYAYDYYAGLRIARQQLRSEGIVVNTQAYDIGNEEDKALEMINNVHFQQSDLILGPLYSLPFGLIADFANLSQITMVNPLATDGTLLENGRRIYLAHPSIDTQTMEVLRLAKTKTATLMPAIYYGTSAKDSAMAFSYRGHIMKAGGKVLDMKKLSGGSEEMNAAVSLFTSAKPNHVVFFSNAPRTGQALLDVLTGRELNGLPIIAMANSFGFNQMRPTRYGRNLYLIAPDYIDTEKESVKKFEKEYYERNNTLPSVYSYQGYDHLLFFGRMLAKYQDRMTDGLEMRQYDDDYLLSGFDYTLSRENTIPSILKYEEGRWVPWTKPY